MQLSKFISIVLHPIFMPLLVLCLTLKALPSIAFVISQYLHYVYGIVIFCTIILPLLSLFFLIKTGRVSSLEMSDHKDRFLPLF